MSLKKFKWLHSALLNLYPLHSSGITLHGVPRTFHLTLDHVKVNVIGAKSTAVMLLIKVAQWLKVGYLAKAGVIKQYFKLLNLSECVQLDSFLHYTKEAHP
jgi:hypothetical protein